MVFPHGAKGTLVPISEGKSFSLIRLGEKAGVARPWLQRNTSHVEGATLQRRLRLRSVGAKPGTFLFDLARIVLAGMRPTGE